MTTRLCHVEQTADGSISSLEILWPDDADGAPAAVNLALIYARWLQEVRAKGGRGVRLALGPTEPQPHADTIAGIDAAGNVVMKDPNATPPATL